jgi:hypothetical protein
MEEATAREELAWIRSLMDQNQRFLRGTWRHQFVWGLVGTVGLVGTWLAVRTQSTGWIPWIWVICVGSGWAYSLPFSRGRRSVGPPRVRSAASRAFGGIWMALGVTLTLLGTVSMFSGAIEPRAMPGIVAVVFGSAYFATGFVGGLRWIQIVGVTWWIGGVGLLFQQGPDALLVLAAMTVALEIGPALRLRGLPSASTPPVS